jgi:hypothetical protein
MMNAVERNVIDKLTTAGCGTRQSVHHGPRSEVRRGKQILDRLGYRRGKAQREKNERQDEDTSERPFHGDSFQGAPRPGRPHLSISGVPALILKRRKTGRATPAGCRRQLLSRANGQRGIISGTRRRTKEENDTAPTEALEDPGALRRPEVILPEEVGTRPGPDPEFSFIESVSIDDLRAFVTRRPHP